MFITKTELYKLYKSKCLIPMDLGINLSLISIKEENFSIYDELDEIEEFLTEMNFSDSYKKDFLEEVCEYFLK